MATDNLSENLQARTELFAIPSLKDFQELSEKDGKVALNADGTLTLKNKLVMREGFHNDVHYTWTELKARYLTGEGAGLFYDHNDSVANYAGMVKNLKLNEKEKAIYGDIHVTDKQAALNLSKGAKWGISPTMDIEAILKDGEKHAADINFLSYSLVLRPAVRETMLNSDNTKRTERGFNKVEKTDEKLLAEKVSRIQELEDANARLEEQKDEANKKASEAEEKAEEIVKKDSDNDAEELCALECKIGFTSAAEKDTRLEELKSSSSDVRANLRNVHEKYSSILELGEENANDDNGESAAEELKEGFLAFRKEFMGKNPKATEAEVRAAYAKSISPADSNLEEASRQANAKGDDAQDRMKSELSAKNAKQSKVNSGILAYMKEQEQ